MDDKYQNPGPLQFEGPGADAKTVTLCVEDQDYMGRIKKLREYLDKVQSFSSYAFLSIIYTSFLIGATIFFMIYYSILSYIVQNGTLLHWMEK